MDKKHLKCRLWKVLWGLSFLSLVLAWSGFDGQYWMWNALVLAMLAVPIKLDCQSCKVCQAG